ncbi:uncharacterized protein JN550_000761 [Neoarthrinium moseri]|uniref:uncharacterized protein n=1 Tax=Neoarthrinium moseri TaxID=1658444 RepID=UPI001FDC5409|nr:uncharacterized protein JN550_000761 [Neoarthrinium moseri]KAI1876689.1 hypothetical protein JN550_000761 [Neoarthrinium moseri]
MNEAHAALLSDGCSSPHFKTPELSPIVDLTLFETPLSKPDQRRVEEPLMPLEFVGTPSSSPTLDLQRTAMETCHFQDEVSAEPVSQDNIDALFSDDLASFMQQTAVDTNRAIEQERIEPTATIARVSVPVMDFNLPELTWDQNDNDSQSHFRFIHAECDSISVPEWHRNPLEDRQMWWNPFPSKLGHISLTEAIDYDNEPQLSLHYPEPQSVPTSECYVWKKPGLSILEGTDDEELETCQIHIDSNHVIHSLVRKRKLDMLETVSDDPQLSSPLSPVDLVETTKTRPIIDNSKPLLVGVDDPQVSSTLLSNFVGLRNYRKRKNETSSFFSSNSATRRFEQPGHVANAPSRPKDPREKQNPSVSPLETAKSAPLPVLKYGKQYATIITALNLDRGVVDQIEKLLPGLSMVERDFERWNMVGWDRNSVLRSPIVSPLAAEADIIVSPSTGILTTTLIQAIQQPLPGHKGKAAIRHRIEKISLRYERLIVLVSEANRLDESARVMNAAEQAAFSELSGFVAGLNTETQLYYVGGGKDTLSQWLAHFIVKYYTEESKVNGAVMADETTAEMLLRRAGLNAFAAQIILATLKAQHSHDNGNGQYSGIASFINMPQDERIRTFGQQLGGSNVIRRVGAVLDAIWELQ